MTLLYIPSVCIRAFHMTVGSHIGVLRQCCVSSTLSLCKQFLLFQSINIVADHVSENAL